MSLGASDTVIPALAVNWTFLRDAFVNVDLVAIAKECLNDPSLIVEYYKSTDAFVVAAELMTMLTVFHCAMGEITRNYSQVDKAWSILPAVYAWHFTLHDYLNRSFFHPRLLLGSILITLWGMRLTYNFARKGGYEWHGRDYRFVYIHEFLGQVGMSIFNMIFIGPFQDTLLLLMVTPLYLNTHMQDTTLNKMDLVAAILFLVFLFIEGIADDQQFMFQTKKYALLEFVDNDKKRLSGDYKKGFLCSSGLWQYSRHPNFFAEISLWWCVYLFSVAANLQQVDYDSLMNTDVWINWTIPGAVILTMLFQGSTWLTEYISSEKYPEYLEYRKNVNRFIPWFPNRPIVDSSKKDL